MGILFREAFAETHVSRFENPDSRRKHHHAPSEHEDISSSEPLQGRCSVDPGALRHRRRLRHRSRGHRLGRGPGSKYLPRHLRLLSVHSLQSLSKGSLEPFASLSRVFNRFRTVGSFFSDVLIRNGSFLLLRFLRALSNGPRFPSGSIPFFRFSSPF